MDISEDFWSKPGPSHQTHDVPGNGNGNISDSDDSVLSVEKTEAENKKDGSFEVITLLSEESSSSFGDSLASTMYCPSKGITQSQANQTDFLIKRVFQCPKCNFSCNKEKDVGLHFKEFHQESILIECIFLKCDFNCACDSDYISHVKSHFISAPYKCEVCPYETNVIQSLVSHSNIHIWLREALKLQNGDDASPACEEHHSQSTAQSNNETVSNQPVPNQFQCKICKFSFATEQNLVRHQKSHAENFQSSVDSDKAKLSIKFTCHICTFSCSSEETFHRHQKFHDETYQAQFKIKPETFNCRFCSLICENKENLLLHERNHEFEEHGSTIRTEPKSFNCDEIEFSAKEEKYLKLNKREHASLHPPRKVCRVSKNYNDTIQKEFKCILCHFVSKKKKDLIFHQKSHKKQPPVYKNDCTIKTRAHIKQSKTFKKDGGTNEKGTHMKQATVLKNVDDTVEKIFQCNVCPFVSKKKYYLVLHQRSHKNQRLVFPNSVGGTTEKDYKCNLCSLSFKRKCHFSHHQKSHKNQPQVSTNGVGGTTTKDYKCNLCSLSFKRKCHFTGHQKSHKNQPLVTANGVGGITAKDYKCNLCSVSFKRKCHFSRHQKSHGNPLCEKKQCQQYGENRSIAIYQTSYNVQTSNKYKCNKCPYSFQEKKYLDLHKKVHNEIFKCSSCGKGYKYFASLKKHMDSCKR